MLNIGKLKNASYFKTWIIRIVINCSLDLLRDKYKTVIILKYFNDMTIENILDVMEIPQNTVKTYLRRAKGSLSKILREIKIKNVMENGNSKCQLKLIGL